VILRVNLAEIRHPTKTLLKLRLNRETKTRGRALRQSNWLLRQGGVWVVPVVTGICWLEAKIQSNPLRA